MFVLVVSLLCWLPATAFSSGYNSNELTRRIKTGAYLQKTDNLMIIVDGQGKADWLGRETQQVKIAKLLIDRIGSTIPNIPHRRMLRVFGPSADGFLDDYSTIFGLFNIDANNYTPIIATKTLPISDNDPMELTFFSAIADLKKIDGTHAIILISRGEQFSRAAIAESAYLKKAFGGSVCFYPIYIGDTQKGEAKMQQFKRIGGCGTFSTYGDIDTPGEMTDFVESVFFAKKRNYKPEPPVIASVPDEIVSEEQTPEDNAQEIIAEPYEPELVSDIDEEPMEDITDDDIIIIERQLPHDKVVTIELHVEFDLNKASVKPEFNADIQHIADFMSQYPETEVLLEGHTCNLGSEEYNLNLSHKRAEAVQNSLISNFGIAPERIKTRGAGEAEPIAENTSEEGRIRNRRVMAVISTIVTDFIIIEQEISKEEFLSDDFVLPPLDEAMQEQLQSTTSEEEVMAPEATTQVESATTGEEVSQPVPTTEVTFEPTTAETGLNEEKPATQTPEDVVIIEDDAAFDTVEEETLTVSPEGDETHIVTEDMPNWK